MVSDGYVLTGYNLPYAAGQETRKYPPHSFHFSSGGPLAASRRILSGKFLLLRIVARPNDDRIVFGRELSRSHGLRLARHVKFLHLAESCMALPYDSWGIEADYPVIKVYIGINGDNFRYRTFQFENDRHKIRINLFSK